MTAARSPVQSDEGLRRVVAAIVIPAGLALVAIAPAWMFVAAAIWLAASIALGLIIARTVSHADRHSDREQGQREPVSEGAGSEICNFHNNPYELNLEQDHA